MAKSTTGTKLPRKLGKRCTQIVGLQYIASSKDIFGCPSTDRDAHR